MFEKKPYQSIRNGSKKKTFLKRFALGFVLLKYIKSRHKDFNRPNKLASKVGFAYTLDFTITLISTIILVLASAYILAITLVFFVKNPIINNVQKNIKI